MNMKPIPVPTSTSQPFWDALADHRVVIQQCKACAQWVFYPRSNCPHCLSNRLAWREVSGKGRIYTFTVARIPTLPEFADEAPQLLAVIELEEGVRINSTLVNAALETVRIGMRVKPVFAQRDGMTLLRFTAE